MKTKDTYFYVACDGGLNVNETHRHYFRLYKDNENGPLLVDQGLANKVSSWVEKYDATLNMENPYPNLD